MEINEIRDVLVFWYCVVLLFELVERQIFEFVSV